MSADGDTVTIEELLGELDRNAVSADPFLAVIFADAARELRAALARMEAAEIEVRGLREGWDGWQRAALAAEAQRDTLAEALRMQGWDIGEAQLCWCPPGWFDREEETGAEQTEHSTGCRMARAAMEALA